MFISTRAHAIRILLPACATLRDVVEDPVVVHSNSQSITCRYSEGLPGDAKELATNCCRRNGRQARLEQVTPCEGNDRTAVFVCV